MPELTAPQLVTIATRTDTGSHNRLDLIQSLLPPHYVCNGYVLTDMYMLCGCELIDAKNISLPSQNVKFGGEQADIFQYQSYSHSDDMFIILKSNINTHKSIFVFSWEKSHDSKFTSPKHSS